MPAAIATTFFSAPHSSTPRTSVLSNTRSCGHESAVRTSAASAGKRVAITLPASLPRAISLAMFGPDEHAELPHARFLEQHLRHAQVRAALEPLDAVDDAGARGARPRRNRRTPRAAPATAAG